MSDDRDASCARSAAALAAVGAADVVPVFGSRERPLLARDLETATGVLVGGGLTPAYHDAIRPSAGAWLPWLRDRGIVGGWKLRRGGGDLVVCSEDVSEAEEYLDVRPGRGPVPFAVAVHASRWGTPTRLLHAVRAGLVREGWAIDEETMVEVAAGAIAVHGLGGAYRVRGPADSLRVEILVAGERQDVD